MGTKTPGNQARLDEAVEKALEAFWAKFAKQYPEATSGDFPPGAEGGLIHAARSTANLWLTFNAEACAVPVSPYELTDKLLALMTQAVKTFGNYDPDDCLCMVEEQMTIGESRTARAFLGWCHANGRKWGHGNVGAVFAEFVEASWDPKSLFNPDKFMN